MPDNMLAAQIQPPVGVGPTMQSLTTISNMNSEMRLRGVQTQAAQLAYGVQKQGYDLIAQGVPAEDAWMRVGDPAAIHTMAQAKLAATQEQALHVKYVQDNMGKLTQGYEQMVASGTDPKQAGNQIMSSALSMGFITQAQFDQVKDNVPMQKQLIAWAKGASLEPSEARGIVQSTQPGTPPTTANDYMAQGGSVGGPADTAAAPAPPPNTLAAASAGAPNAGGVAPPPNQLAAASTGTLGALPAPTAVPAPQIAPNAPAGLPRAAGAAEAPLPVAPTPLPASTAGTPPATPPTPSPAAPAGPVQTAAATPPAPSAVGPSAAAGTPPVAGTKSATWPTPTEIAAEGAQAGKAAETAKPPPQPTFRKPLTPGELENQRYLTQKGIDLREVSNASATAAFGQQRALSVLKTSLATLVKSGGGFLTPGPGEGERIGIAKGINTMLGAAGQNPLFPPNAIAAAEQATKQSTNLGFDLARSLGSREALQIVQQSVSVVPNFDQTELGQRRLVAGLDLAAQYTIDRDAFVQSYATEHGMGALDAPLAFNTAHPPEDYTMRAILRSMGDADGHALAGATAQGAVSLLLHTGASAVDAFDTHFGAGLGDWVLAHPQAALSEAGKQY